MLADTASFGKDYIIIPIFIGFEEIREVYSPEIPFSLVTISMMAQMAHFSFPYYYTISNSEFQILNSEFWLPNSDFRNMHYEFRNSEL